MISHKTIINDLLSQVDTLLANYAQSGYQALVDYLTVPLGAAIVLFFVCYGVMISQGWIKGSVAGLTHSLFKIGIIYFLAMNWGHFSFYVYNLFYKGASEIGAILLNASPIHFSTSEELSINSALQEVLDEIWVIAQLIFQKGGVLNPGSWIGGVLVGLVGFFLVGLALLEIVIAKCMLSILFVIAPLFIAFTLFEVTQGFFDKWLGSCVGYASLMILISASLGIVLSLDYWMVNDMYIHKNEEIKWINTGTVILVTWVCIGIIKRITLLAMSIGDSVSAMSGDELLAGAVGALLNPSRESSGASRSLSNNTSANKNKNQHSNSGGPGTGSGSSSNAINPAVNDRSRFVDGRSNNHDLDNSHSKSDNYVKPDNHTRPDNYTRSDTPIRPETPTRPDHSPPDNQTKVTPQRSNFRRSSSNTTKNTKKEFEDYD